VDAFPSFSTTGAHTDPDSDQCYRFTRRTYLGSTSQSIKVKLVYCLARANSSNAAKQRVLSIISAKKLELFAYGQLEKIICLPVGLSKENLGLDEAILKELNNRLTTVIHNAWALQRLGIRSFESHHIKGTFNLLNLYLSVKTTNPARLFFRSSILAVASTPLPATILETYTSEQSQARSIGMRVQN